MSEKKHHKNVQTFPYENCKTPFNLPSNYCSALPDVVIFEILDNLWLALQFLTWFPVSMKDPPVGGCISLKMPSGYPGLHGHLDVFFYDDLESFKNANTCRF